MKNMIIFDFDGTISNSVDIVYRVYEKLATEYGFKHFTHEEIHELKMLSIHERLKKHHVSIFQLPKLARKTRKIVSELIEETYPFEGIKDLLELLKEKGLILSIVSSNSKKNIESFIRNHGLIEFDYIYGKASFFGKERLIRKLLKKEKDAKAIYVGDELRDIVSAKEVPIDIISVTWGFDDITLLEAEEPTYITTSIEGLKDLLLNYAFQSNH
ncbi:MAG: HAD hydrolase-like protein [Firmicutes bacterium]|nr:HAD hydrolase-like protein [Bacillota bacterium]